MYWLGAICCYAFNRGEPMPVSDEAGQKFADAIALAENWLASEADTNNPPPVSIIDEACDPLADWSDAMPSEPRRLIEEMSADLGVPGPHNRSYAAGVRCLRAILAELQRRYLVEPRHR